MIFLKFYFLVFIREWCEEAIKEIARYNIGRGLSDYDLPGKEDLTLDDVWQGLEEDKQFQLIRDAMEKGNIYAETEYSSSFIRTSEVAPHVAAALLDGLTIIKAAKLADGTLVSLGEIEPPEEESDQYGRTSADFISTNTHSTAAYVAEWYTLS